MERQTIDITVRNFHKQSDAPMHCSIVVGHIGLNACICRGKSVVALRGWHFDQNDKSKIDIESSLRDLNTVLATEPIFDYTFESVSIFLSSQWATLVPTRLFDESVENDTYLSLLTRDTKALQISSNPIEALDCQLVYGIEKSILKLLLAKFPSAKFSHISHPMLLAWNDKLDNKDTVAFINFNNYLAQMTIFSKGKLVFFNSFLFSTPADFLYFALLPFHQLKLDPLKIPLTLSGEIVEQSALHKMLMRYIRNINFMPLHNQLELPGEILALPNHFHFDLFSGLK